MPKKPTGKHPPIIDFEACVEAIKKIYESSGTASVGKDLFASRLGFSGKSSGFHMRISCFKQHNLIEDDGNSGVKLTKLGLEIVAPTEGDGVESKVRSFLLIPTYKSLHEKYVGGKLPDVEHIKNALIHEKGFDKDPAKKWASYFTLGCDFCRLVSGSDGNRILLGQPQGASSRLSTEGTKATSTPIEPKRIVNDELAKGDDLNQYISIPFGSKVARIPNNLSTNEYEALKGMIEAFKSSKQGTH